MAMSIVEVPRPVTGGIDTHLDAHVAAVVDVNGGVLAVESFAATTAGFAELRDWLVGFGEMERVGVEGTGAYGAGLARHLRGWGLEVIEVDRPNRQARRRAGKSDPGDAVEAARAVLAGRATGIAKVRRRSDRSDAVVVDRQTIRSRGTHYLSQPAPPPRFLRTR